MPRWLAVSLGCVTALGMQIIFGALAARAPTSAAWLSDYVALGGALVLAGYVTGTLAGRFQVLYAALMAIAFILLTATYQATRDAIIARELGLAALPPIDFVQLTVTDVLAMTAACGGGWLAERFQVRTGTN